MSGLRNKLPEKQVLKEEVINSQTELKEQQVEVRRLEKMVEDASDSSRLRILSGENPTRNELTTKLDKVEVCMITFFWANQDLMLPPPSTQGQLVECEQQLLEKELLFEQVGKLTERASKKVEGQQASTLAVAKKVNNYQSRIKDITRKMMAHVSELSMQQVGSNEGLCSLTDYSIQPWC